MIFCYRYVLTLDARSSSLFARCRILIVNYLQIRIVAWRYTSNILQRLIQSFLFSLIQSSESLDWSVMSCSSFVTIIWSFTVYATVLFVTLTLIPKAAVAFVHKTYSCNSFFYGCSVFNVTYVTGSNRNSFYYMEQSTANSNSFKIAQKTAFEAKGRLYTTGKVIQRLFIIDLYT